MSTKEETSAKPATDKAYMAQLLKNSKTEHFNFLKERYWKISSGSLLLDSTIGGITPGLHRFVGQNSGGKTSEALEVMRNFFNDIPESKGVYFNAEGRLTKDLKERCGLKFVTNIEEWDNHTVFVIDTNVYEFVAKTIRMLINMEGETFYGVILDSVDGLALKNDLAKEFEEATKVAGGSVIASTLMKQVAIPLSKRGHFAIFISQVRSDVVIDPYAAKAVRQISSTGGNALLHYANLIIQFEPRFTKDLIYTVEKEAPSASNPLLGHWASVIIKKSGNETQNYRVRYPIKYGAKGKSSIWVSKEITDSLLQWEFLERAGAWYNFSEDICSEIPDIPTQKFQGLDSVNSLIEKDEKLQAKLFAFLKKNISGSSIIVPDEAA